MTESSPKGERIAKVLARAGVASRRKAEEFIAAGRVGVNGKTIDTPATLVTEHDKITFDGKPVGAAEPARLWLYNKPKGLVTSEADEKGRKTVFETLPSELPRVLSVGRLDINSEGLLLLTNDGEIKRRLELPSTGWLRRYRVRVNGLTDISRLDELRKGAVVDGVRYQPMQITFDREQGANAWLTFAIREGKNREIRRAIEHIGAKVNRLIRVSYGPFQIGNLKPGEVEEVRRKVLRDQLGLDGESDQTPPAKSDARSKPLAAGKPGEKPARRVVRMAKPGGAAQKQPPRRNTAKPKGPGKR